MEAISFSRFITAYNRIYKETDQLYHQLAKHFGLPDSAFWILYILACSDQPLTQSELVSALCLSKQTIHSALKNLEQGGFIRLSGGGRNKHLHLTSSGLELTQTAIRPVIQMEERAFLGLDQPSCEELLACNQLWLDLLRQESAFILNTSQED